MSKEEQQFLSMPLSDRAPRTSKSASFLPSATLFLSVLEAASVLRSSSPRTAVSAGFLKTSLESLQTRRGNFVKEIGSDPLMAKESPLRGGIRGRPSIQTFQ